MKDARDDRIQGSLERSRCQRTFVAMVGTQLVSVLVLIPHQHGAMLAWVLIVANLAEPRLRSAITE